MADALARHINSLLLFSFGHLLFPYIVAFKLFVLWGTLRAEKEVLLKRGNSFQKVLVWSIDFEACNIPLAGQWRGLQCTICAAGAPSAQINCVPTLVGPMGSGGGSRKRVRAKKEILEGKEAGEALWNTRRPVEMHWPDPETWEFFISLQKAQVYGAPWSYSG